MKRTEEIVLKENYKDIVEEVENTNPSRLSNGTMIFSSTRKYSNKENETLMEDRAVFNWRNDDTVTIRRTVSALGDFHKDKGGVELTMEQLQWLCSQVKGSSCV